jgi:hypothetical protein
LLVACLKLQQEWWHNERRVFCDIF